MKKDFLKAITVVFSMMLCIFCMAVNTFGYAPIDTEKETSLTLTFGTEQTAFSDVKFQLYHVAEVSEIAEYTLNPDFADSGIELTDMTADTWQKTTDTLVKYIKDKKIAPVAEKATDADGIVTFAGLKTGLYLVVGESCNTGTEIYIPTSFMVSLPELKTEMDTWDYEVVANVKYTVTPVKLPQTGQLWWPVLLLVPGIAMAIAGIVVLCKKDHATAKD